MTAEKPIEVIRFHSEETLSVPERKARFEKEGIGLIVELDHFLHTVGQAEFDPSDHRKKLHKKMEERRADLMGRAENILGKLPERLAKLLGETVLLPPDGQKAAMKSFLQSTDLHQFEAAVVHAEVFLLKLEAFEKKHSHT